MNVTAEELIAELNNVHTHSNALCAWCLLSPLWTFNSNGDIISAQHATTTNGDEETISINISTETLEYRLCVYDGFGDPKSVTSFDTLAEAIDTAFRMQNTRSRAEIIHERFAETENVSQYTLVKGLNVGKFPDRWPSDRNPPELLVTEAAKLTFPFGWELRTDFQDTALQYVDARTQRVAQITTDEDRFKISTWAGEENTSAWPLSEPKQTRHYRSLSTAVCYAMAFFEIGRLPLMRGNENVKNFYEGWGELAPGWKKVNVHGYWRTQDENGKLVTRRCNDKLFRPVSAERESQGYRYEVDAVRVEREKYRLPCNLDFLERRVEIPKRQSAVDDPHFKDDRW